ncbi:MAG: hypothetical protein EHM39_09985, partial [Chloroflexi bacterium]
MRDVEGIILIFVAVGALIAFGAGIVLLVLYMRSGRGEGYDYEDLVRYGNLVQCPRCGYMNPAESAACLNCRLPFAQPRRPVSPAAAPNYPTMPPTALPTAPPAAYPPPAPRPTPAPQPYAPPAGSTVRRAAEPEPAPSPAPPGSAPLASAPLSSSAPPAAARSSSDMPHAWLEHVSGPGAMERENLTQTDTMIGRSTVCDIQVPDPKVS